MGLQDHLSAILDNLGVKAELKRLPNVVNAMVTVGLVPGHHAFVGVWFDVAMGDPYGKFSPQSKNFAVSRSFHATEFSSFQDESLLKTAVSRNVQEMIEELRQAITDPAKAVPLISCDPPPLP